MRPKPSLGKFLKEQRVRAKLTQIEVANKLGYSSAQFVSNWERGTASPPINTLKKICVIYNIPPQLVFDELLTVTLAQVETNLKKKFFKKTS